MADDKSILNSTQAIAVSALRAQQSRMRVIAENIANADSTADKPGGNPYRRQEPIFQAVPLSGGKGVRMSGVRPDPTPFRTTYSPGNPAADAQGYVKLPNVDPLIEATDYRDAQKAYEANLNVIETSRAMDAHTLDILKP